MLAGVASLGVVGLSLLATVPAHAATDADCVPGMGGNVVDGSEGAGANTHIQSLLSSGAPVICLSGSITISSRLAVSQTVAFHGYPSASLVGDNSQIIIAGNPVPISIENLHISGGRYSGGGGAIQSYGTTVRNSTFEDNRSNVRGGAIYARGPVDIERSTFTGNQGSDGSAIYMASGDSVRVVDSTFSGNAGAGFGAAIVAYGVTTVSGSTFEDNTEGALDLWGSSTVSNSTFVRNGGYVAVDMADGSVTNSTFLDNPSGAVRGNPQTTVRNNIFAASTTQTMQVDANSSTDVIIDGGGNVFTSPIELETMLAPPVTSTVFGVTSAALFTTGVLADNGGPAFTLALDPAGPAVDAAAAGAPSTDQRGQARAGLADAGAFEYVEPIVVPAGPAGPAAPTLPATGSESGWLGALAALLLAAGAVALTVVRRQRRA